MLNLFLLSVALGFIVTVIRGNRAKPQTVRVIVTVQPALNKIPVREPESLSDVSLPYFMEAYHVPSVN